MKTVGKSIPDRGETIAISTIQLIVLPKKDILDDEPAESTGRDTLRGGGLRKESRAV